MATCDFYISVFISLTQMRLLNFFNNWLLVSELFHTPLIVFLLPKLQLLASYLETNMWLVSLFESNTQHLSKYGISQMSRVFLWSKLGVYPLNSTLEKTHITIPPQISHFLYFVTFRGGAVCQKEPQADAAPARGLPEREAGRWNPPWDVTRPCGSTAFSQPGGARGQSWHCTGTQGKGDALHRSVWSTARHGGRGQTDLS